MAAAYRIAPVFAIRMAGVPFDVIEQLSTPETCRAAREIIARRPEDIPANPTSGRFSAGDEEVGKLLDGELTGARRLLLDSAARLLPEYLVFASSEAANLGHAFRFPQGELLPARNNRSRGREQHLLLYLQRICTKNDTFSEFGPTSWGRADGGISGINFEPRAGFASRDAFLERWTAHAVAAAMNADPDILPELMPRLNPNGRIEDQSFILTDTGEKTPLSPEDLEIVEQFDGKTPVHALGASAESVRRLMERNIVRAAIEVPALEAHAFQTLCDDVQKWRAGATREKWLAILQPIAALAPKFAAARETLDRKQILDDARSRLQAIGAARESGDRSLYSAVNPIGEESFRETNFRIGENLLDEVAVEAAPWIDLWRDSYAFVANRVAAGLRQVFEKSAPKQGSLPLPAFLRACEGARLPLTGPGLVALSTVAFQEVKSAFRERLRPHADEEEYELTADDCRVVREKFDYAKFDEYTYPSGDLQISAGSAEAVERGDYQWILAELHPPVALLHHCMYWSCPDKATLNDAFAASAVGKPNFHFGFFAADFTAHTTVRLFDAIPQLSNFVAPQRDNPEWRTVRPADAEVYVEEGGDVCVRNSGSHEHLGSFARAWVIPLGFHPFQFAISPHTPRLRCGRVIVQRRSWSVSLDEMPAGNYTGISRGLVMAVERLREEKKWPRYIYIRPTEQALRRSGAEGRDKDTKPVFIDLESYLFLEIFHRWLTKAGELEITEMLPDPDHLLWREPDGRRTFELRTLILPRS